MLRRLAFVLLCMLPQLAAAEGEIRHAEIIATEDGYVVNADIDIDLNPRLEDAVEHGVSLYFTADFVIERARWYWIDEVVAERRVTYRLSYQAITRSYRLSIGAFHQNFETLDSAVRTMTRIRNLQIVGLDVLEPGHSYNAAVRFRLDTAQLPKPFQVTAIGSRDWNLGTDWMRWTFLAGAVSQ